MELKRYEPFLSGGGMRRDEIGRWCDYVEVAAILAAKDAENAKLTDENRALKAEVERLEAEARRLEGR